MLGELRAGDGRTNGREIERERLGVDGLDRWVVPHPLFLCIGLDEVDELLRTAGGAEVRDVVPSPTMTWYCLLLSSVVVTRFV